MFLYLDVGNDWIQLNDAAFDLANGPVTQEVCVSGSFSCPLFSLDPTSYVCYVGCLHLLVSFEPV